jgi:hypothetical protein
VVENDLAGQLSDIHTQTAREQGTGRGGGIAVANKRRGFHEDIELDWGQGELLTVETLLGSPSASEILALILAMITVRVDEVVHGEGQATFRRASTFWGAMTGERLLRAGGMGDDFIDGGSGGGIGVNWSRRDRGVQGARAPNKVGDQSARHGG